MSQSPRVLIADDDRVLVELLSEFLSSEGCVVSQAFDGSQAVDLCREPQFDLVVMDIMMPELNGIEALKQLRGFSAVPVIMLTARGEELDRILGLELGADDYLSKPCNPGNCLLESKLYCGDQARPIPRRRILSWVIYRFFPVPGRRC